MVGLKEEGAQKVFYLPENAWYAVLYYRFCKALELGQLFPLDIEDSLSERMQLGSKSSGALFTSRHTVRDGYPMKCEVSLAIWGRGSTIFFRVSNLFYPNNKKAIYRKPITQRWEA